MKKILTLFLCGMFASPVFAEVAPSYFYEDVEYVDEFGNPLSVDEFGNFYYPDVVASDAPVAPPTTMPVVTPDVPPAAPVQKTNVAKSAISPRVSSGRATTTSRTTSSAPSTSAQRVVSRSATSRPITSRVATIPQSRGMVSSASPSRATTATAQAYTGSAAVSKTAVTASEENATLRRASQSDTNRTVAARAGLLQADTINQPLYIGTDSAINAERVASRPTIIVGSSLQQSVSSRAPSISNATTVTSSVDATAAAEEIVRVSEICSEQFFSCMDNFCDVLDETQGRCVCSSNMDRYKEIETALKDATEALQDVAQKIQYIGLTKDEIEAIFKQTEAEAAMVGQRDTSQIQADLNKIRKMIIEVDSETYSTNSFSFLLDVDFSFDNGFNLYDWLMGINSSVLRQRGQELYTTALSKCRTNVLDACKKQGVDTSLIISNYDLAIDKQCIAYEKILNDENDQMKRTVRNATNVLQKARLVIAQNKNVYDLRGCVNALDSCMQDDFACGMDYEFCLDPTGKYLANGEVIVGSQPGFFDAATIPTSGLFYIWNYSTTNAWATSGSIDLYIDNKIKSTSSTNMVGFLQAKIGSNDGTKNTGMCMSVLNQCQDYTYTAPSGGFNPANDVIRQYLMRSLATIKARQDEIVSEFASSCIARVASCLQANYSSTGYDSSNKGTLSYASYNACRSLITTCASVNNDPDGRNIIGSAICYQGNPLPRMPNVNEKIECE